jgi:predicted O-methyltransferase YrrM
VDNWQGGAEHQEGGEAPMDMRKVENNFNHNLQVIRKLYPNRIVTKRVGESCHALRCLAQPFDLIYIDGSHTAKDVLTDACMTWPILKNKGMMVFDDYLWGAPADVLHRPKIAIDAFTTMFAEELKIVHTGYQVVIQKELASLKN